MIYNATLTRIDSVAGTDAAGKPVISAGAALRCRCCVNEPTANDRYTLASLEESGSLVLRVLLRNLTAALAAAGYAAALAPEMRLQVARDKIGTVTFRARSVVAQPHGAGSVVIAELRQD